LILRHFFSVFDESGHTDEERKLRVYNFLEWFEPIVLPFFYGDKRDSPIGNKGKSEDDSEEEKIPSVLAEALLICAHGFLQRQEFLEAHPSNIKYDENTDENLRIPVFNGRASSSMDVEAKFSELGFSVGREGRGSVGKANQRDVKTNLIKLKIADRNELIPKNSEKRTNYDSLIDCKTLEDMRRWNHADEKPKFQKRDKNNASKTHKMQEKATIYEDPGAVRGYHSQKDKPGTTVTEVSSQ
jgi:hypothetical protein